MQMIKITIYILLLLIIGMIAGVLLPVSALMSFSVFSSGQYVIGTLFLISFLGLLALIDWLHDFLKKLLFKRKRMSRK